MKKIFTDTRLLDKAARENFGLTEDIMMENAAAALEAEVCANLKAEGMHFLNRPAVLVLCGPGNNGADGYALARRIFSHDVSVTVCEVNEPKSEMCILQKNRAVKTGVRFINIYELDDYLTEVSFDLRVIVDCIFGSGFHGTLGPEAAAVLEAVNAETEPYKIACDVPSGNSFCADSTVTMGALKLSLFSDEAKDMCGKIKIAGLGISSSAFENAAGILPEATLLEEKDLVLPVRNKCSVNKGSFGHAALISGEKTGAAVIASSAALRFGAGLVTVVSEKEIYNIPYEIMQSKIIPENTTSVALGMGLGRENKNGNDYLKFLLENKNISAVLDADILSGKIFAEDLKELLKVRGSFENIVLTPHPKEFSMLLSNLQMGEYSVKEISENRLELVKKFCEDFPGVTLVLKGANVIIAHKIPGELNARIYINTLGTSALAKAGSGDVLTGLTAALLAQKKGALESAVNASLAHALASQKIENNFSMTPFSLIEEIIKLKGNCN